MQANSCEIYPPGSTGTMPKYQIVHFWMGLYGGFSAKPTKVFGDAPGP